MPTRKILLQIMLWSLAIAAVLGAGAILAGELSGIWRVSATTLLTAVAAGAMIPVSMLMDKPRSRQASMLGMWAILFLFFLAMLLIWNLTKLLPGPRSEEATAMTLVATLICVPFAMCFLTLRHAPRVWIAGWLGVVLAVVVYAILLIGAWTTNLLGQRYTEEWMGTAAATGGFGLLAAACLVNVNIGGTGVVSRWLFGIRLLGVFAAGAAMAIAIFAIWHHIHRDSVTFTTLICIAAVVAHANLCMLISLTRSQQWVRVVTMAAAMATAVFLDLVWIANFDISDKELLIRLAAACGLVASCGSLALLVLVRINRRITEETPVLKEIRELTVICPGCHKKQVLPVGEASCPTCRLRFHTSIHEPRCPKCEYLLFMLNSDHCPECGESI